MNFPKSKFKRQSRSKSRSKSNSRSRSRGRKQAPQRQYQPTHSLSINKPLNTSLVQSVFESLSIQAETSLPDQTLIIYGMTVIKYPSMESASKVMDGIQHKIAIQEIIYDVEYYPKKDNKTTYDWCCDQCNYTNYARRNKCNRCENTRNNSCKPVFNNNLIPQTQMHNRDQINPCSLMLRGQIISEIDEVTLIDIFQHYGPLKDIRMIRNKLTGKYKDFAFLEYFTPQEAAEALKVATNPSFRIQGQVVSCIYSKNRKQEGFFSRQQHPIRQQRQVPTENYYEKERERQIRQYKEKEIITMEKLKQRKQQQLKKQQLNSVPKQLSKEKMNRKLAEQSMKEWEKNTKVQSNTVEIMYVCPLCCKKFKGELDLKNHQQKSALHKRMYDQLVT